MEICPHCDKETIRFVDKLTSTVSSPAKCRSCNSLSAISGNIEGVMHLLGYVLLYGGAVISLYFSSVWPVITGIFSILVIFSAIYIFTPLTALTEEQVKRTNKLYKFAGVLGLVLIIFVALEFN